jgi:hypothetical protein
VRVVTFVSLVARLLWKVRAEKDANNFVRATFYSYTLLLELLLTHTNVVLSPIPTVVFWWPHKCALLLCV